MTALAILAMLALLLIEVALLLPMLAWYLSGILDVPFVPTPESAFGKIVEALDIRESDAVYELGSGDGRLLIHCAKRFPAARFVGIERNPFLCWYAKLRARLAGAPANLRFVRGDFFKTDFSQATKIYAYLLNPVMDGLLPKFAREFKGTLVSRAFVFKQKQAREIIKLAEDPGPHNQNRVYVYDF